MVRAKFKCSAVHNAETAKTPENPEGVVKSITLAPVTAGDPENTKFWKSTPSGSIQLNVLNPTAAAAFVVGDLYYVDFTPASLPAPDASPSASAPAAAAETAKA